MEQRKPPQYILDVFADPTCVKDIVRGILHTIFFHRYFPSIKPSCFEVLDLTLPLVANPELETLIDTRVGQLVRQLFSTSSPRSSVRGSLLVQFFEKKRRKAGGLGWFTSGAKGEEEVCWESWCLEVTLATPKTEIADKSDQGHGFDIAEDGNGDYRQCKSRQRTHPADNDE
ncbi:hypothetical protein MMC28_010031 [Mycoblastus sanguinarius]|nr:hypothetical protein [Mycoblastus sanguinarius]